MSRRRETLPENEWTVALSVDDVPEGGALSQTLTAPEEVYDDLVRRLDIVRLRRLSADLKIVRQAGGRYHVSGRFSADIIQNCVVTAEPIASKITEPVEGWFLERDEGLASFAKARKDRDVSKSKSHAEVEILDESDDPEPVIGGQIDLGELVVQHLSLAINPYPHKPGARHEFTDDTTKPGQAAPTRKSPFEALKDWKEKR